MSLPHVPISAQAVLFRMQPNFLSLIGSPNFLERASGNRWVGLHVIYCVSQHTPCYAHCL
jgi:hypothetical protein